MRKDKVILFIFSVLLLIPYTAGFFFDYLNNGSSSTYLTRFNQFEYLSLGDTVDQINAYFSEQKPYEKEILREYNKYVYMFSDNMVSRDVLFGRDEWLFYRKDNSVENYMNVYQMSEDRISLLLENMKKIEEWGEENSVSVRFMITPNKETIYGEKYLPEYIVKTDEVNLTDKVVSMSTEMLNNKIIFPKDELCEASENYQTYFKYDTHWNEIGGFIASQVLLDDLGIHKTNISNNLIEYDEKRSGDLASMIALDNILNNDITPKIINYKESITTESIDIPSIGQFLQHKVVKSDFDGDRLLIVGDSFISAMLPTISKSFSSTEVIHRSNYNASIYNNSHANIVVFQVSERFIDSWIESLGQVLTEVENGE